MRHQYFGELMLRQILFAGFALLVTLLLLTKSAVALEVNSTRAKETGLPQELDGFNTCVVRGAIEAGDLEKLEKYIGKRDSGMSRLRCELVYLNSEGGNFSEAVKIMDYFFTSMIATSVEAGATCYSACAVMWLGGSVPDGHNLDNPHAFRRLNPKGVLGFHAPYVLLSDGRYSNYDVMMNGTLSFKIAQELLVRFQDHRIPMWFASKLLHPDPEAFYVIETIEDANLIGASVVTEKPNAPVESSRSLGTICFNLSHWGKNRSARDSTNKKFSNNESTYSHLDDYIRFLDKSIITGVSTKYVSGLESFLKTTAVKRSFRNWIEDHASDLIDFAENASQSPGSLLKFWQQISRQLGPDFAAVAPSFLRWKTDDYSQSYSYLFPSPGIVGAHDENIRDRPEWCAITLPPAEDDARFSSLYAVGTEFDPMQELIRLPAALLALPADTKLIDVESKLQAEEKIALAYTRPGWCVNAGNETERKICEDAELSGLDLQFERDFATKKLTAKVAATLSGREMIKQRNKCGSNVECMRRVYKVAIESLGRL